MPTATPMSCWPDRMMSAVSCRAVAAVAQPLYTSMKGMPVSPRRLTTASGLSTSKLPPNANCTSFHGTAGVGAGRPDGLGPHLDGDLSPKRPKGWRPTPMMATSSMLDPPETGLKANVTMVVSPSSRNGTTTSSTSMPKSSLAGSASVRRASTRTSSPSCTRPTP